MRREFTHGTRAGLGLEIPVIYRIYGGKKYLERLVHFIHSSETATLSLRRTEEGLSNNNAQKKKRKSNQTDKGEEKKRRK